MAQVCWMENGKPVARQILPDHSRAVSAHVLARILLDGPDLPVATHANNHSYSSRDDGRSHGELKVQQRGTQIHIGNLGPINVL